MAELSEQDKWEIRDFFAKNKRQNGVCVRLEESFQAVVAEIWAQANKIDQLQSENEELKRENDRLKLKTDTDVDMAKPQPCTVFQYAPKTAASTLAWVAKLNEESNEAIREALKVSRLAEVDGNFHDAEVDLAEELTDVITVCTSWLHALGYDEYLRGEVQRRVNEKNKKRGYF